MKKRKTLSGFMRISTRTSSVQHFHKYLEKGEEYKLKNMLIKFI